MGYHIYQEESQFFIAKDYFDDALAAIKSLAGQGSIQDSSGPHFSWVGDHWDQFDTLEAMLYEWRWDVEHDEEGNICHIEFTGEKSGDDECLFRVLAPFVREGSHIDMRGEDGEQWQWQFKHRHVYEAPADATSYGPGRKL